MTRSSKNLIASVCAVLVAGMLLYVSIAFWATRFPLYSMNYGYQYMPKEWVKSFFAAYPFVNLIVFPLSFFSRTKQLFFLLAGTTLALYVSYTALPVINSTCASCMCVGLLPRLKMEEQLAFFIVAFILTLTGLFLKERHAFSNKVHHDAKNNRGTKVLN